MIFFSGDISLAREKGYSLCGLSELCERQSLIWLRLCGENSKPNETEFLLQFMEVPLLPFPLRETLGKMEKKCPACREGFSKPP
jgi:hypothetical protein